MPEALQLPVTQSEESILPLTPVSRVASLRLSPNGRLWTGRTIGYPETVRIVPAANSHVKPIGVRETDLAFDPDAYDETCRTLTAATALYGATMQESGVSKRVSVR